MLFALPCGTLARGPCTLLVAYYVLLEADKIYLLTNSRLLSYLSFRASFFVVRHEYILQLTYYGSRSSSSVVRGSTVPFLTPSPGDLANHSAGCA